MNNLLPAFRLIVIAMPLAASIAIFSGCATTVQPVIVGAGHPANPHAASGTPAPVKFPLLAPSAQTTEPAAIPAEADEKAPTHVHHHDS